MFHPSPPSAPGQPGAPANVHTDEAVRLFRSYVEAIDRRQFSAATAPHRALLRLGYSVLLRRPRRGGGG